MIYLLSGVKQSCHLENFTYAASKKWASSFDFNLFTSSLTPQQASFNLTKNFSFRKLPNHKEDLLPSIKETFKAANQTFSSINKKEIPPISLSKDKQHLPLSFRPLEKFHKKLIQDWLKKDHVREFWNDGGVTLNDLDAFLSGKNSEFHHWVAFYESIPFAYLMTSEFILSPDIFAPWRDKEGKTMTLDFLIGESAFLGRGIAHKVIQQFLYQKRWQHLTSVLIDPEAKNTKAIHIYRKAGFEQVGEIIPSSGSFAGKNEIIMKLKLK